MQFLLVTLGSIGDLMPYLVVADRLRARGHRCIIASNAGYAQLVQGSGFPFVSIWERGTQSLDAALAGDSAKAWDQVRTQMFEPAAEPTLRCICDVASVAPTIVLASWSAFGAARARAQLGVKLATLWLSPYPLVAHREEAGAADVDIALYPDWFAPAPVRQTGFPLFDDASVPLLPAEVETFLAAGPPPVIMTPGSFMRQASAFFEAGLEACARLRQRAILLTPYADQIPALPASARHFSYLALQRLAPRARALIHHGGIGTTAQGLRAGLPQLLAPVFFDQFDNAARLEALGVGQALPNARDCNATTAALEAVLAEPVQKRAQGLRTHFDRGDPVELVCDAVEALA